MSFFCVCVWFFLVFLFWSNKCPQLKISLSDSFNSDIVIAGKTRATKSVDEKKEFEIPPGCQLVILGSHGMEQLLFPGFNEKLKEYFGSGDTIEKFSALKYGANILQHYTITSVPSVSGEYFPFF